MSKKRPSQRVAVVGTVGVPARYGGFETLAENLVAFHERHVVPCDLTVYCSTRAYPARTQSFRKAALRYVDLDANGASSPLYDLLSMLSALRRGVDTILVLGVSGTLALPFLRLFSRARYVVNVDGLEWKRAKWSRPAALFLRASEWAAARFAHVVIADNQAIVDHIRESYGVEAQLIPYGGDHAATAGDPAAESAPRLPDEYALLLCRIEPENNVHIALEAFAHSALPLVAVGNWQASEYGRELWQRHADSPGIRLLDAIYDPGRLHRVRGGAKLYVHGHSAGGTNPSLVEMMWLARPVLVFDCIYNRHTTDNAACYFSDADGLRRQVTSLDERALADVGSRMGQLAAERYNWETIGGAYFDILLSEHRTSHP